MKSKRSQIPAPALPKTRKKPLPGQKPKPADEDPGAPSRLEAILNSSSYRKVEEDAEFLIRDEVRGPRLQLDYLKSELLIRQHGIEHTIVVFGGTRILEPAAARRKVQQLQQAVSHKPQDRRLQRELAIAKRIRAKSRYYEIAREFTRLVSQSARAKRGGRLVVMTGGGPGIMEAANRGAYDIGAESIGLNITLPQVQFPNPYITPELCFLFHYFSSRKLHFLLRAKALVSFPGGYGTFDELFEALSLIQTRKIKPMPVVLVGRKFWRQAFDIDFLVNEGVIDPEDRGLFWYAETAAQIWKGILDWHDKAGTPLFAASRPTP